MTKRTSSLEDSSSMPPTEPAISSAVAKAHLLGRVAIRTADLDEKTLRLIAAVEPGPGSREAEAQLSAAGRLPQC